MPSDFFFTGWVDRIEVTNGNKNGKEWTKTNFCIHEPFVWNGEQKEESTFLTSFNELNLSEGEWYRVGARLRKKKGEDGKFAGFDVQAITATMLTPSVSEAQKSSQTTRTQAASRQYSNAPQPQRNNGYQQRTQGPAPRGPESFVEDDIPF